MILVAGLIVKLTSPGPALYWQTRVGLRGREFRLCKIRTMVANAEAFSGPVWATSDDIRITPFGAFLRNTHIDELPQLVHVLFGRMSLVGPRPERPEFVNRLQWEFNHYNDRVNVRPGITGLAQLRLPPDSTIENVGPKLEYDLYYVRNVNPWLDLRILFFTAVQAIGRIFEMAWSLLALPRIDDLPTSDTGENGQRRMTPAHLGPRD
ncbi:MAG: sugar transferase [Planctomycetaceae bacterium]